MIPPDAVANRSPSASAVSTATGASATAVAPAAGAPAGTRAASTSLAAVRAVVQNALIYGACGGLLFTVLRVTEYRFLVLEHSVEIYGALIAGLFSALGIWLGITLTRKKPAVIVKEVTVTVPVEVPVPVPVPAGEPFVCDEARQRELGITPRELEILGLIAEGLSNREVAARLFVSENTVKTHSRRLFDKLGAQRRTQAVQRGKLARLIP